VIVEGRDVDYSTTQGSHWVAFINNQGEYVWDIRFDDIEQDRYSSCDLAIENDDGSFVLFVRLRNAISTMLVSSDGELLDETTFEASAVLDALQYEHGYIIMASTSKYIDGKVVSFSDQFIFLDNNRQYVKSYEFDGYKYTDIVLYNGKIYLSANEINPNGIYGYAAETFVDENGDPLKYGSDEKLLKLFKDFYTSFILVFDPESGIPEQYYCVKGAFSGEFSFTSDGKLVWEAQKITSVAYSPYTSSFTFSGKAVIYRYVLDSNGKIVDKYDTLEAVSFQKI
jgi:hypothetical protein